MDTRKRLDRLEKTIRPEDDHPPYLSVSVEDWDRLQAGELTPAELGIDKPVKVYVGLDPDKDWDSQTP